MNNDLYELEGLYVGLLNTDEIKIFEEAINKGCAYRSYSGPGGILGIATVGVINKN